MIGKNIQNLKGFAPSSREGLMISISKQSFSTRHALPYQAPVYLYDLLVYHDQLPAAIQFMEKFPDQAFILDHLGKPAIKAGEIKKWKENIRIMAQHPRTFCKLSGLATEADLEKMAL